MSLATVKTGPNKKLKSLISWDGVAPPLSLIVKDCFGTKRLTPDSLRT